MLHIFNAFHFDYLIPECVEKSGDESSETGTFLHIQKLYIFRLYIG